MAETTLIQGVKRSDDKTWLKDGNLTLQGGVDGSRPPSDVPRDQSAFAVNSSFRSGFAHPRPGWKKRPLTFPNLMQPAFEGGVFQQVGFVYNGDTFDCLLTGHGGRQFKINVDVSPGIITTTNANFTVPALNATVVVTVLSSINLNSQSSQITIAGYPFTLTLINSTTQITIQNNNASFTGTVINSGATVEFKNTWSVDEITPRLSLTTLTTSSFTVPAAGSTVAVQLENTVQIYPQFSTIIIGGQVLTIVSVDSSTQITVLNSDASQTGNVVASLSTASFTSLDTNDPNSNLNWCIQAENYWILQNNRAAAMIFDGATSFRSDPSKFQIPVGNVMAYAAGRVAVSLPDQQTYMIGDLVFGSSGTQAKGYRDSVLYFTENMYLNEGGTLVARVFGAPSNSGPINSMKACVSADTALGQGPLLIGTPNVMFSVQLPFDRTTWKNLANPLQTVVPMEGPLNQNGCVLNNTDMWYRASDGFRSYITAERQFNGSLANTPQSNEIGDDVDADTQQWLKFGSGALFDNRLLETLSPQMTPNGCYHRGLAVIDFDLITGLRQKLPPAWEGIWTGLRILQIVEGVINGVSRCFIFHLNDNSKIELWELTRSDRSDNQTGGIATGTPITWFGYSPSYNCGDSDMFKKLKSARLIIGNVTGAVTGDIQFRPDEGLCWNDWYSFALCAKQQDCGPYVCGGPKTYSPQPRYPIRCPEPPDVFDDVSKRKLSTGYEFQLSWSLTGYCELRQIRIYCISEPENLGIDMFPQT